MTRHRLPIAMGGAMGLAMPWMMHVPGAGAVFVLAHVAVAAALAAAALAVPGLRRRLHRPEPSHIATMIPAAALGWGATCAACLAVAGQHWS